jgi:hypothetical protein
MPPVVSISPLGHTSRLRNQRRRVRRFAPLTNLIELGERGGGQAAATSCVGSLLLGIASPAAGWLFIFSIGEVRHGQEQT